MKETHLGKNRVSSMLCSVGLGGFVTLYVVRVSRKPLAEWSGGIRRMSVEWKWNTVRRKGLFFMEICNGKGGAMFQKRREKKKREQEFLETKKMGEELYREEKERNKEHESEADEADEE